MKKLHLIALLTLMPSFAFANGNINGWLEPLPEAGQAFEFKYGKDLVIIGENLTGILDSKQSLPVNRQVCFVSELNLNDKQCYGQNDSIIKNWSPNNITFSIPEDISGAGTLKIRFERYEKSCASVMYKSGQVCDDVLKWGDEKVIGNFKLSPVIKSISNDSGLVSIISQNSSYIIEGAWFGTGKGNIIIGNTKVNQSSITSWLPNKITFNSDLSVGNTLRIQNGSSQSLVFDLSKQNISQQTSSSRVSTSSSEDSSAQQVFTDITENFYASNEISALYTKGIIQGYSDGTFKPSNTVNRAELLKLLIAGLHSSENKEERDCFPDVGQTWFSPFVCAAKRLGWVAGYESGLFKPADTVNRAEAIKMIVSSLTKELNSDAELPSDVPADSWFAPYVRKAVELEIVIEATFKPADDLSRADAAVWIYRGIH